MFQGHSLDRKFIPYFFVRLSLEYHVFLNELLLRMWYQYNIQCYAMWGKLLTAEESESECHGQICLDLAPSLMKNIIVLQLILSILFLYRYHLGKIIKCTSHTLIYKKYYADMYQCLFPCEGQLLLQKYYMLHKIVRHGSQRG